MSKSISALKTGTFSSVGSRFHSVRLTVLIGLLLAMVASFPGCTLFASRPTQLMSDTAAAIRAAKGVQADTLAPELYRQANEWFFRAKHEYKFKNFKLATDLAEKARRFAEQAEFQSLKNGGKFVEPPAPELPASSGTTAPPAGEYATPTPTSVERMEQIENQRVENQPPSAPGTPRPSP